MPAEAKPIEAQQLASSPPAFHDCQDSIHGPAAAMPAEAKHIEAQPLAIALSVLDSPEMSAGVQAF